MPVSIVFSDTHGIPIYAQIAEQIKTSILSGEAAEGEFLPSVRALARDLRVSVITITRAYADLANEGYIASIPKKGSYVLPRGSELAKESLLSDVEEALGEVLRLARLAGLSNDELHSLLDAVAELKEV